MFKNGENVEVRRILKCKQERSYKYVVRWEVEEGHVGCRLVAV